MTDRVYRSTVPRTEHALLIEDEWDSDGELEMTTLINGQDASFYFTRIQVKEMVEQLSQLLR